MSEVLHVGFTGTRFGMTEPQHSLAWDCASLPQYHGRLIALHHGCCVGGDEEIAREASDRIRYHIVGHPPSRSEFLSTAALEFCDEIMQPQDYMARNRAIVNACSVIIAAPFENEPQPRGGTWATIRMALKAKHRPTLYVVVRDGQLLDVEKMR